MPFLFSLGMEKRKSVAGVSRWQDNPSESRRQQSPSKKGPFSFYLYIQDSHVVLVASLCMVAKKCITNMLLRLKIPTKSKLLN